MTDSYEIIGRVTTESVFKGTGKHWRQWMAILDKAGARAWTRAEIVAHLKKRHKLSPWWQQGVTHGFEVAIGRRVDGQDAKGRYTLTVTKSLRLSAGKLWKLLLSEEGQALWLLPLSPVTLKAGAPFETDDGFFGEVRTLKKDRSLRLRWQDPGWERHTTLQVFIVPKSGARCILVFNHNELADLKTKALLRTRWRAAADAITRAATKNSY